MSTAHKHTPAASSPSRDIAPNTTPASPQANAEAGSSEFNGWPLPERTQILVRKVQALLENGRADEAVNITRAAGSGDPFLKNLQGVCLIRAGNLPQALRIFRELALLSGGVCLKPEAPTIFKTNFATALLLSGNIAGSIGVLDEIVDREHPAVRRLRAAVDNWKTGLTFWQKFMWKFGTEPNHPVALDGPPGDLL